MQYIEAIKGKACMLLMHHTFDGAVHGAHQFTLGGISPKYIPDYMQVYSGHIHMRQRIKQTIVYTGAPLQHDFGEAGYEPGYVIVDLDGDPHEYTFYPVPEDVAPRFHILPHNLQLDEVPGHERQDYYRIDLPTDVDPREISELVCELDNVMVKPIPIDSDTRSRVEEHLGEKGEKVDFFDVMAAYAAMKIDDTERAERIYAIGEDIATSVLPEAE